MVIIRSLIIGMLLAGVLSAQEVGLTARPEKQELRLGEPVIVTVTARLSVEVDSIGPLAADSLGMFEVLSVQDRGDNAWAFELMTIDTGRVFLPPIAFGYVVRGDTVRQSAYANSLLFTVAGIEVADGADIRDIKPPMGAPWTWSDIWPYLLAVVLAGGAWFVYRKYFRKESTEPQEPAYVPPPTPPHVQALRELRELEEKKLWQQGRTKEYYSACTEIVRRFFEGRYRFPALELTSFETLEAMSRTDARQSDLDALREFFDRADIVKFAKGQPSPEEHQREMAIAYEVVRSMGQPTVPERAAEPAEVVSAG